MAAFVCPHCESMTTFLLVHEWRRTTLGRDERWAAWSCANTACQKPVVGRSIGGEPAEHWPDSPVRLPPFDDVPESIRSDALESYRCFHAGANRAAAVMARRAIQGSAFDKGAPDKRPVDQIDWLKDQALITPHMAEIAHHIRSLGGSGAHPGKDGLEDVTRDEATQALTFLSQFMDYVYTIPASLEKLRTPSDS